MSGKLSIFDHVDLEHITTMQDDDCIVAREFPCLVAAMEWLSASVEEPFVASHAKRVTLEDYRLHVPCLILKLKIECGKCNYSRTFSLSVREVGVKYPVRATDIGLDERITSI